MFLLKSIPATKQISIDVSGAGSHTLNMRIPVEEWKNMIPGIESSIQSSFRDETFEVTVSFQESRRKKSFSNGNVDLTEVFGAVVPGSQEA